MEKLQIRIWLKYIQGKHIAYFYNREDFDLLNIEKETFDQSQFIKIGTILKYEGKKYFVKKISFCMEKELWEMNPREDTDPSDFNGQLIVFVDNE